MRLTRDPELARVVDEAVERGHNPLSTLSSEYIRREVERRQQLEAARQQEERSATAAPAAPASSSSPAPVKAAPSFSPATAPPPQPAAASAPAGRTTPQPAAPRSEPPAHPKEIAQAQLPPPGAPTGSAPAPAGSPPQAAPQNPAPPAAAPPSRPSILKPEREIAPAPARPPEPAPRTPPPAPIPSSGVLVWSGELRKGDIITIEGSQASSGTLQGALPGVPVILETDYKGIGFAEMPGPSNGWKRVAFRALRDQKVVITLRWRTFD